MKSTEFLQAAIDVQAERGKQYDKPSGERSMGATISAFNCITGYTLEESDGWMLLGLLKLVRQSQNPEQYHHDSALDFVAYASLYAEAASEQCGQLEAQQAEEPSHIISDNNDGWIDWSGGKPPLPPETDVDVKLEDGAIYIGGRGLSVDNWEWEHNDEGCNIIAYRATPTSTAQ
jgi:hypothetical protein